MKGERERKIERDKDGTSEGVRSASGRWIRRGPSEPREERRTRRYEREWRDEREREKGRATRWNAGDEKERRYTRGKREREKDRREGGKREDEKEKARVGVPGGGSETAAYVF